METDVTQTDHKTDIKGRFSTEFLLHLMDNDEDSEDLMNRMVTASRHLISIERLITATIPCSHQDTKSSYPENQIFIQTTSRDWKPSIKSTAIRFMNLVLFLINFPTAPKKSDNQ